MGVARYHFNESYFKIIDSPEKAYWLGLIYADGTVRDRMGGKPMSSIKLSLASSDGYIIERFRDDLNSNHPVHIYASRRPNEQSTSELVLNSKYMCADLERLGVYPRKSLTLLFPTEEQVPSTFMPHFIRGYFDGDGSITHVHHGKFPVINICGTKAFLESMRVWLAAHGVDIHNKLGKRHLDRPHIDAYSFYITSTPLIGAFFGLVYTDATRFLTRKRNRFDHFFLEQKPLAA